MATPRMSLRCRTCLRQSTRPTRCLNLPRTFSTSSAHQRHGAVTTFPPTSSPELDAIIATFRTQVFLPAHLPAHHLRLLHRPKHQQQLLAEPFNVEIADETFRLSPRDPFRDPPSTTTFLQQMLGLMKQPQDWTILPTFLTELRIAKRRLKPGQFEKLTRKANEMGRHDIIERCIQQADRTGFILRDVRLVREVLWGAYRRAQESKWDSITTKRALQYAERIAHRLDSEDHCGEVKIRRDDPCVQPDVIGIVMLLAAVREVKHLGGKDEEKKVAMYTERLRSRWDLASLAPLGKQESGSNNSQWRRANEELQRWTPVRKAMEAASRVSTLQPELKTWLKTTIPTLEEHLRMAAGVVSEHVESRNTKATASSSSSSSSSGLDQESTPPTSAAAAANTAPEKPTRSFFDRLLGRAVEAAQGNNNAAISNENSPSMSKDGGDDLEMHTKNGAEDEIINAEEGEKVEEKKQQSKRSGDQHRGLKWYQELGNL
ncbi:MAG: hypothetical protein M1823_003046 [Watsoniomyces obsoletus]|nr:MAG: hypothetical protein M1823_003046 [Watsoniomyces obsoletus]